MDRVAWRECLRAVRSGPAAASGRTPRAAMERPRARARRARPRRRTARGWRGRARGTAAGRDRWRRRPWRRLAVGAAAGRARPRGGRRARCPRPRQEPRSCHSHFSTCGPGRRRMSVMRGPSRRCRGSVPARLTLQPRQRLFKYLPATSSAPPQSSSRQGSTVRVVQPSGAAHSSSWHGHLTPLRVAPRRGGRDLAATSPPVPRARTGLPVAAVARRLGVAPATLRTWDRRYGLGPTSTPPGRTAATPRPTSRAWRRCAA